MKAVLLSGGMDSIALSHWKRPEIAITIDYGQAAAAAELAASAQVAFELGMNHHVMRIDCSSLGSGDMAGTAPLEVAPASEWWPFRNQLLVTLAGMRAVAIGVTELLVGSVLSDGNHADGRSTFYAAIDELMRNQEGGMRVSAPAIGMSTAISSAYRACRRRFWHGLIPATSGHWPAVRAEVASSTSRLPWSWAVSATDAEPSPRIGGSSMPRCLPPWEPITDWPPQVRTPGMDFFSVLTARRSSIGGTLSEADLASLLRLATMLRTRRFDGRFGEWESRTAPSAGGLHAISLLALPVSTGPAGLYDDARHCLLGIPTAEDAIRANRENVMTLAAASTGTTIQLVADAGRYDACYLASETLMWRDSGVLLGMLALVATALSLRSVILGRTGRDIVEATGLGSSWTGVGAIHVGSA